MNNINFIIGRNPNVSHGEIGIKINDPTKKVSSNHCRISYNGMHYYIEDLISVNGTFVNNLKISSKTLISKNDIINLGENYSFSLTHQEIQSVIQNSTNNNLELRRDTLIKKESDERFDNKFANQISSFFGFLDNQIFYRNAVLRFYEILIILFLLTPFIFMYMNRFLDGMDIENISLFRIILLIFIFIASIISILLLLKKRNEIQANFILENEGINKNILGLIVKTIGELTGLIVLVVGLGISVIELVLLFLFRADFNEMHRYEEFPIINGLSGFVIFPLISFLSLLIFNYISTKISDIK